MIPKTTKASKGPVGGKPCRLFSRSRCIFPGFIPTRDAVKEIEIPVAAHHLCAAGSSAAMTVGSSALKVLLEGAHISRYFSGNLAKLLPV